MMEQLVSYETAVLAEKKGFDWPSREIYTCLKEVQTLRYFEGDGSGWSKNSTLFSDITDNGVVVTAPSQSLLQKWIREKHGIFVTVIPSYTDNTLMKSRFVFENHHLRKVNQSDYYPTYEEALEAGLLDALNKLPDNEHRKDI